MDNNEEEKVEEEAPKKSSQKSLGIIILVLLLVSVGVFYYFKRSGNLNGSKTVLGTNITPSQQSSSPSGKTVNSLKGQKLSDTRLADKAYQIFPGNLTSDAKTALTGFDMKTKMLSDGSTEVDLIPTETGENYKNQSFTVKEGYKLYFIELRSGDDQNTVDADPRDDMGILVDENGVIQ